MTCFELFWILIGPATAWVGWSFGRQWGPGAGACIAIAAGAAPYLLSFGLISILDRHRKRRS